MSSRGSCKWAGQFGGLDLVAAQSIGLPPQEKDPQARHPERAGLNGQGCVGSDAVGDIEKVSGRIRDNGPCPGLPTEGFRWSPG
jgi:hypothetical protein